LLRTPWSAYASRFAGFHVGLIERVDAEDRARHRRGDFPAEEFLSQVVFGGQNNAHNRVAGSLERVHRRFLRLVGFVAEAEIGEDAVVAVGRGLDQLFLGPRE